MNCDTCVKGRSCRNLISWFVQVGANRYFFCTLHKKAKAKDKFWRGSKWVRVAGSWEAPQ